MGRVVAKGGDSEPTFNQFLSYATTLLAVYLAVDLAKYQKKNSK